MLVEKKAIVFDLDGTLADTLGAIAEAINLTMERFGYPKKTEDQVRCAIGNGAKMLVKRLMPPERAENENHVSEVLDVFNGMYAKTYLNTREMYDGISELIKKLFNAGIKIAVFSNKLDIYVKDMIRQFFPNGEVAIALGQTDIPVKPDPSGLKIILEELSVNAEECVLVGDSGVDLKTAENSGMDFIGVAWGYCGREMLEKLGAETVVETADEIYCKTITDKE